MATTKEPKMDKKKRFTLTDLDLAKAKGGAVRNNDPKGGAAKKKPPAGC